MEIGSGLFSGLASQSTRQGAGVVLPEMTSGGRYSPSASPIWRIKDEYSPSAPAVSASYKRSFGLTDPLQAQTLNPPSDSARNTNRLLLEEVITGTLEANGIKLNKNDILSLTLNGKGELSIDAKSSRINGTTGDDIAELCGMLSAKLNETQFGTDGTLGDTVFKQFAEDLEFDLDRAKTDQNFSLSFAFQYESETEKNAIFVSESPIIDSQIPVNTKDETETALTSLSARTAEANDEADTDMSASIEKALTDVMKQYVRCGLEDLSLILVIDKNGQFLSGGGILNRQAYDWDAEDQREIGLVIKALNETNVNGMPLAEAMLQQFAKDLDVDLSAERMKDSFYYTCVLISPQTFPPDCDGFDADSFVRASSPIVTVDDKHYAEWNTGINRYHDRDGTVIQEKVHGRSRAFGQNYMDAPWNQNSSVESQEDNQAMMTALKKKPLQPLPSDIVPMFDTVAFETAINRLLGEYGIVLKSGDSLVYDLSKTWEVTLNYNDSHVVSLGEGALDRIGKIFESRLTASFLKENAVTFL